MEVERSTRAAAKRSGEMGSVEAVVVGREDMAIGLGVWEVLRSMEPDLVRYQLGKKYFEVEGGFPLIVYARARCDRSLASGTAKLSQWWFCDGRLPDRDVGQARIRLRLHHFSAGSRDVGWIQAGSDKIRYRRLQRNGSTPEIVMPSRRGDHYSYQLAVASTDTGTFAGTTLPFLLCRALETHGVSFWSHELSWLCPCAGCLAPRHPWSMRQQGNKSRCQPAAVCMRCH